MISVLHYFMMEVFLEEYLSTLNVPIGSIPILAFAGVFESVLMKEVHGKIFS